MTYIPPPPLQTNHVRGDNLQIIDGDATARVSINLASVITTATWETVGPTGSGADNIWTEMDNLPDNATAILVSIRVGVSTTDANTAGIQVYVTEGDGTAGPDLEDNCIAWWASDHDGAITGTDAHMIQAVIPLEYVNKDFRAYWSSSSTSSQYAILYYRGFMTD